MINGMIMISIRRTSFFSRANSSGVNVTIWTGSLTTSSWTASPFSRPSWSGWICDLSSDMVNWVDSGRWQDGEFRRNARSGRLGFYTLATTHHARVSTGEFARPGSISPPPACATFRGWIWSCFPRVFLRSTVGFDDGGRWLMAPEGNDPEPVEPARSDCACRIREFHTTGLSEGPRKARERPATGQGSSRRRPKGGRNARCTRWPECEFPGAARVARRGLAGEPELSRSQ